MVRSKSIKQEKKKIDKKLKVDSLKAIKFTNFY